MQEPNLIEQISMFKNSFLKIEAYWCRKCGKILKYSQYLPNPLYSQLSENKTNEKEELEKRNFMAEHGENCIKKKEGIRVEEINDFLNQKLSELRTKKGDFERFFDEDKTISKIESFFDYDFFRHLVNSTYRHFRYQLSNEFFPYSPPLILFSGFVESNELRGWVRPRIFRYKVGDKYIMRQTLSLSLNKKFKTELTELSSQIPGYNFSQLIKTTAHEISHCLLGDLFRILGYNGDYSHQFEHRKIIVSIEEFLWKTPEIQLLLPLQIKFIEEKIFYLKEKIHHLEMEEEEMETSLIKQELLNRRDKREKIREVMKYLAELQVNCEKLNQKNNA